MAESNARLIEKALGKSRIFSRCRAEDWADRAQSGAFAFLAVNDGEEIDMSSPPFPGLGMVLRGKLMVRRCDGGHMVTLNELAAGDSFGAAGMFISGGECQPVTQVLANGAARIAVISEAVFHRLLLENGEVCTGYITFLSDRIRFLNVKVRTFQAPHRRKRLRTRCFLCRAMECALWEAARSSRGG